VNQTDQDRAMELYQTRRSNSPLPEGILTSKGLWIPYTREMCQCCHHVDFPTVEEPDTYLAHSRTLEHCKQLILKRKGEQSNEVDSLLHDVL